ncbi:MAG TPA: glycosyltransferase family 2 protein [Polyangiaceae bacterium]|jgi:glycosyltransferase involved in cell wall biosynthesis|nr:glycosyltransferase family 2 protein [Polyangiaceae bacterium]
MRTPLPTLSLVVPSFNQAPYLRACFDSILSQEYPALELIVMDGGSTDGSKALIEKYSGHFAHWQSERDGGQGNAINAGFARASGTLFTWLNSDDTLLPGALWQVVESWCNDPGQDVLYGDHVDIDATGRIVDRYYHPRFHNRLAWWTVPYIAQQGTVFTRALWEAVGGIDAKLHCMLDYDLWFRFMKHGARFGHVGRALGGFRRHSESKGGSWHETYARERAQVAEHYKAEFGSPLTRKLARGAFVCWQAANGNYARTLSFRLTTQRRLRRYQP